MARAIKGGVREQTDGLLLRRIAAGEQAAFDVLWERHAPMLLLRLRRRAPQEAADLVQETFLAAWRNAGSFSGEDAGGWLWTIAARRLIDSQRRARVRPVPSAAEPDEVSRSAEDEVLDDLFEPALLTALGTLSPELRMALQAIVVDGLSTREAAQLLGVSESAVKSRTHRARRLLRERLAHPNRLVEET